VVLLLSRNQTLIVFLASLFFLVSMALNNIYKKSLKLQRLVTKSKPMRHVRKYFLHLLRFNGSFILVNCATVVNDTIFCAQSIAAGNRLPLSLFLTYNFNLFLWAFNVNRLIGHTYKLYAQN